MFVNTVLYRRLRAYLSLAPAGIMGLEGSGRGGSGKAGTVCAATLLPVTSWESHSTAMVNDGIKEEGKGRSR